MSLPPTPSPKLQLDGKALAAWETTSNDENQPSANVVAQKTLLDLKKQLSASATALKRSKTMINVLRGEKKALREQNEEFIGKNTQLLASLESTKSDAMAISSR